MPSTFFGLNIGYTGLNVHQGALHTTAHNITNAETQGYSRQYLDRQAGKAVHVYSSYGMVGTGVIGTGIYQIRDSYYDEKYRTARTVYGEYYGRSYYMAEVQSYFNEINNEGFTTNFSGMFTSLEELAKDPSSGSARRQAINSAMALTEYFNNMSTNLKSVQEGCNFDIKNTVDKINSIGEQLATLNKQINTIEVKGVKANDLRDQRNLMIDELSELVNVSVEELPMGAPEVGLTTYAVKVNGTYLVNDYQYKTIEITPRDYLAHSTDVNGIYDLTWSDGQDFDLYGSQLGGKLAALVALRDGNNEGNLQGKVTASVGDTEIVLTETNVNSVSRLNIPEEGVITVGNQEYKYTRFEVEVDEETGEFTYHFELDESKPVVSDVEEMSSRIGEPVNFKGVPYYLTQMNEFIRTFAKAFNDMHKLGEDLDGNKGIDFFNGTHPAEGTNYKFVNWERTDEDLGEDEEEEERENAPGFYGFSSDEATYYKLNADNFTITRAIWDDENLLAAAGTITQGVEEKKVLDQLIALKDDIQMFRQGKPESFFQTWISDVGIDTSKADDFTKSQKNIMDSIDNQRLSISGVDTDEEAMDLIRFQKAYELSSKVISVMDEIYNKLINEMAV